jgi:hypothetical protein
MILTLKINGVRKKKMKAVEIGNGRYWLKEINMKDFSEEDLETLTQWVINEKAIRLVLEEKEENNLDLSDPLGIFTDD